MKTTTPISAQECTDALNEIIRISEFNRLDATEYSTGLWRISELARSALAALKETAQ